MIESVLKVFILEDLENDVKLIKRQVLKIAPQAIFTVAKNKSEFFEKISWATPDVVLSDYGLPDFNGLQALLHIRENMPHIPFIFITGTLNSEEKAAQAILHGASGYILKENLRQIPQQLQQIIEKNQVRIAEEEKRLRMERKKNIVLQKIHALLRETEEFRGKSEIETALKEVL